MAVATWVAAPAIDGPLARIEHVALEVLQPAVDAQSQLVRELAALPDFTARDAARHHRVAPRQARARRHRDLEALREPRAGERNHWIPVTVQLGIVFEDVALIDPRGIERRGRMRLQRGLR